MSADDKEFKWSDIYFEATKPGASEEAIRIKDHAFHEAQELIECMGLCSMELAMELLRSPELVIGDYCRKLDVRFDEKGNVVRVTLNRFAFDIMRGEEK